MTERLDGQRRLVESARAVLYKEDNAVENVRDLLIQISADDADDEMRQEVEKLFAAYDAADNMDRIVLSMMLLGPARNRFMHRLYKTYCVFIGANHYDKGVSFDTLATECAGKYELEGDINRFMHDLRDQVLKGNEDEDVAARFDAAIDALARETLVSSEEELRQQALVDAAIAGVREHYANEQGIDVDDVESMIVRPEQVAGLLSQLAGMHPAIVDISGCLTVDGQVGDTAYDQITAAIEECRDALAEPDTLLKNIEDLRLRAGEEHPALTTVVAADKLDIAEIVELIRMDRVYLAPSSND